MRYKYLGLDCDKCAHKIQYSLDNYTPYAYMPAGVEPTYENCFKVYTLVFIEKREVLQ